MDFYAYENRCVLRDELLKHSIFPIINTKLEQIQVNRIKPYGNLRDTVSSDLMSHVEIFVYLKSE